VITRLEVDGFKSLRDFAVDLEPLTVFIGPNSAGKSNVLDALALLSRLASQPVEEAFKQGRGRALDQFTRRGGQAGATIRFAVEVFLQDAALLAYGPDAPCNRYRYEVVIARRALPSDAERFAIEEERVIALDGTADRWSASHPELKAAIHHAPAALETLRQKETTPRSRRLSRHGASAASMDYEAPHSHTALAASRAGPRLLAHENGLVVDSEAKDPVGALAGELGAYRLFRLDSARLRDPSERLGSDTLFPDASNLPTVLANLHGAALGEIRADLVSLVPGISSFDIVPDGDAFRIDFELSGGERLPARLVSDGPLRILALLTALRVEPHPIVIGIEEPENGVYPGRLRKLLDYLQEIAAQAGEGRPVATQLILTTHSPVVLAALRSRPEHLRFVDLVRRDGQLVTRARPIGTASDADRGRRTISLREIDVLLHEAASEIGP
jgi:predicted ATPase